MSNNNSGPSIPKKGFLTTGSSRRGRHSPRGSGSDPSSLDSNTSPIVSRAVQEEHTALGGADSMTRIAKLNLLDICDNVDLEDLPAAKRALEKCGANVVALRNRNGESALFIASKRHHVHLVQLLVEDEHARKLVDIADRNVGWFLSY